ncbi:MAG: hypothetical protein A2X61_09995 [Ignavibacteria bacterium GWB2_35_12]|nr:MAG: hypothetical protein A2X63_06275 [Ignavibacteria bacterium GWA2_35_8]OGU39682.1 MAG: hypothetical protein A2X61_09995 [Ignavibacteria bacterium GWB2_35_12]OGU96443.1 MAG: hypothetical protein A2220_05360 [Ignavibacteria bacterium RIFOXYA2_FULL_35_10]OGV23876.1 MAG: hypothetical protein A2475_07185 [Ignavibacteria bacterium RIFOXYC2_FULL_35_21]
MELENKLLLSVSDRNYPVKGVWIGLYWTAIESKYIGMSHTYKTSQKINIENAGELTSLSIEQLANRIFSWQPLEASLGVAAINSLIEPKGEPGNIKEYIKDKAKNKTVTIIGRFPFNNEISDIAKKTYILEIEPEKNELPMMACEDVMPKSDINIITATTLINHTLQRLLELGSNGINIVLGPSTPLSPVLFDFGANILAGLRVNNINDIVKSITQGVKKFSLLNGTESIYLYKK